MDKESQKTRARIVQLFYLIFLAGFITSIDEDVLRQLIKTNETSHVMVQELRDVYFGIADSLQYFGVPSQLDFDSLEIERTYALIDTLYGMLPMSKTDVNWMQDGYLDSVITLKKLMRRNPVLEYIIDNLEETHSEIAKLKLNTLASEFTYFLIKDYFSQFKKIQGVQELAVRAIGPSVVIKGLPWTGWPALVAKTDLQLEQVRLEGDISDAYTPKDTMGTIEIPAAKLVNKDEITFTMTAIFGDGNGGQKKSYISDPFVIKTISPEVIGATRKTTRLYRGCGNLLEIATNPRLDDPGILYVSGANGQIYRDLTSGPHSGWAPATKFYYKPARLGKDVLTVAIGASRHVIGSLDYEVVDPQPPVVEVRRADSAVRLKRRARLHRREKLDIVFIPDSDFKTQCALDARYVVNLVKVHYNFDGSAYLSSRSFTASPVSGRDNIYRIDFGLDARYNSVVLEVSGVYRKTFDGSTEKVDVAQFLELTM